MESAICRKFCSYYKPGSNEDLRCGSFAFLARNLTQGEIRRAAGSAPVDFSFSEDRAIREMICQKCDFLVDGCDYRGGVGKKPCGGYAVVEHLLKRPGFSESDH
jgi:hypothetical protein